MSDKPNYKHNKEILEREKEGRIKLNKAIKDGDFVILTTETAFTGGANSITVFYKIKKECYYTDSELFYFDNKEEYKSEFKNTLEKMLKGFNVEISENILNLDESKIIRSEKELIKWKESN